MLTTKNEAAGGPADGPEHSGWSLRCLSGLLGLLVLLAGCTPAGPRALLEGRRLIDRGQYPQAVEKLRAAAVLLGGTNAQAWNDLGLACHHAGELAEAEHAYQRALALNQDLSEARFNLGCLWLSQNRIEAAKAELTAFTLRWPNEPQGFLRLGAAQLRARELSAAERSFHTALRLRQQNPEALNGLGLVQLGRGRAVEAARGFEAALKQQADYGPALLNLAIVSHQHLRNRQAALEKYRTYLALKPPPPNAQAVLALARQLEVELTPPARPPNATAAAPASPAAAPPRSVAATVSGATVTPKREPLPEVSRTAAVNVRKAGPINAPAPAPANTAAPATSVEVVRLPAEPVFKRGQPVALGPPPTQGSAAEPLITTSSVPATVAASPAAKRSFFQRINPLNLVRSREKTPIRPTPLGPASGSAPHASAQAGTVGAAPASAMLPPPESKGPPGRYAYQSPARPAIGNRSGAEAAFVRGVRAQQAHRWAEAVQAYRLAVEMDPSLFEAQYNLGLVAAETGNLPLALSAYEAALAIQPASADARYNFALVLKRANCPGDAVNELEKILARSPNETRAHLALGNLYAQQMGQPAKARQHYLKVLALEPRHSQASSINFWLAANQP